VARFRKIFDFFDIGRLLSLEFLSIICPHVLVDNVLKKFKKASQRIRSLPAHMVVYFVMALPLWRDQSQKEVLRIVCEALSWVAPEFSSLELPTEGAIARARARLGCEVVKELSSEVLKPIAPEGAIGAWYRGMRLMSLDGTCFNVPDGKANAKHFGHPGTPRGDTAFPQMRVTALVETGTHAIVAAEAGPIKRGEQNMATALIDSGAFTSEMLVLADRNFYGYNLWSKGVATEAKLVWRVRSNLILPVETSLPDNSFLSTVRDSRDKKKCEPLVVRVIKYKILDINNQGEADQKYRLVTNILDPDHAPADELAQLYHERWKIETLYGEFKGGLNNNNSILRSKTPDLVYQEFWAMLISHYAIRNMMAKAAWANGHDPDDLSFKGALNIIKRKGPRIAVSPP
jgi:hypothetical protein